MKNPKATVLMPVYNGEKYLRDAMDSILQQDFSDFEFLIINDGSKDGSEEIIRSYTDARIRLVNNEKNLGLIQTLNKGLDLALGEYVVRMDCDDVSLKNRLSVQTKFMDEHIGIGVSGTYYNLLLNGKKALADFPLSKQEIGCYMVFNCPIAHPTAIIRMSLIKKEGLHYRSEFVHSEDYDLWSQVAEFSDLANIPEALLNYRVHAKQITGNVSFTKRKMETLDAIRSSHLKRINASPTLDELIVHHLISDGRTPESEEQFKRAEQWLDKLITENERSNGLDKNYFAKIVLERWLRLCFNHYGAKKGFQYFLSSNLYQTTELPFKQKLEFFKNLYNTWKRKGIKK